MYVCMRLYFKTSVLFLGRDVERLLMVRQVFRSILHGGPIELFLAPVSASRLVKQPEVWDGAYKESLSANRKE